jgi:Tol biopolymer transport system component
VVRAPENGGVLDTVFNGGASIPYHLTKLPGRAAVVFGLFNQNAGDPRLVALNLESRDTTSFAPGGYHPEWSVTGHLLFAQNQGSLFAIPFDAQKLRASGSPIPVLDSLAESSPAARYDISPEGTLIYVAGRSAGPGGVTYSLRLDNLSGGQERIPLPPSDHWDAKFSPDGRRLAYIRNDQVWTYDLDLGTHTQLTKAGARHHNPAWSPDGERVVFSAENPQRSDVDVYITGANGQTPVERFGGSDGDDYAAQWLGDSAVLVYTQGALGENILMLRRGTAGATPLLQADWRERHPRISPDGRWLAYVASEGGRDELYVRRWPALTGKVKVSEGDTPMALGSFPLWSNDNGTLYYRQGPRIIAAVVDGGRDTLRITSRRVVQDSVRANLQDLHPDGRRFLVLAQDAGAPAPAGAIRRRLVVVTNWAAALRERLGGAAPR